MIRPGRSSHHGCAAPRSTITRSSPPRPTAPQPQVDDVVDLTRAIYLSARRVAVGIVGATVFLAGVALLVLPGPGLVLVFAGLSLLATEFALARLWLRRLRKQLRRVETETRRLLE